MSAGRRGQLRGGERPVRLADPDRADVLAADVQASFREHRLLREALVALMDEARAFLEPVGVCNRAMDQARCALEGKEPPR